MTVADDLAKREGALRRYFLKIGGLPYVLNQRVADPTGDDSPIGGEATPSYGVLYAKKHDISDTDILACWRMDAASYADEPDATGNGHTAVDSWSGHAGNSPSVPGLFDTARDVRYDSTPGLYYRMFSTAEHASLRPMAVTVSAWFITVSIPQYWQTARIISNYQTGSTGASAPYYLGTERVSGKDYLRATIYRDNGGANGTYTGSNLLGVTPLTVGAHLGALAYDSATGVMNLYLDGLLEATVTVSSDLNLFYAPTQYGVYISGTTDSIDGYQDDCAIYGAAKTLEWHQDLYSGGVGGLNCLRVPGSEATTSLDLGTLKAEASGMTFELDDVEDPDDG